MGAGSDFAALLNRMKQRWYTDTTPVLASCWLKTLRDSRHERDYWKDLLALVRKALEDEKEETISHQVLTSIRDWILESEVLRETAHSSDSEPLQPFRDHLKSEWLGPYVARLLNEWLPVELANLLVDSSEFEIAPDGDTPVLATGRAIERIMVREHLSAAILETLLNADGLSSKYIYPAHLEMLRDVVLRLLGRTAAPPAPLFPATVLAMPPDSHLPADFRGRIQQAIRSEYEGKEEIQVRLSPVEALDILNASPMRIGCIIVTLDGRWWESQKLQTGDQAAIVFRPGGRLRIDYAAEHAKLVIPWMENHRRWFGEFQFPESLELFGREWRVARWQTEGERDWLELVFRQMLPIAEMQPGSAGGPRRSHSAAIDMAWAALGDALTRALEQKSGDPIEQLRRSEFIPLGRALLGLAESMSKPWPKRENIERQLRSAEYMEAEVSLNYGRVPWRILPGPFQANLLKKRSHSGLFSLMNQVFDGIPGQASESSPSRAA